METERIFEEAYRTIEQKEVAVIRDVHGFPVKSGDIISPYMMLFICHSGSSRILYDMREAAFRPNEVAMILPNHIIRPIEQYLAIQAKNLLSSRPDLSVQQISDHLGYADSSSFCRFFKRATGVTPNDFRQHKE